MAANSKVEAAFGAWCKLNETERSEFDQRCAGVRDFLKVQTQVNAGSKAAQTRKQNRQQPPAAAKAATSDPS